MNDPIRIEIEKIYKAESGRVLASLIRILGSLDTAEEALQEAIYAAMQKWPKEGIPKNPYSWLVSAGKFKAIDSIRREARGKQLLSGKRSFENEDRGSNEQSFENHLVEDDQLRLIFYCCHPLLPLDSRIALSLREVCGMKSQEIARAYLVSYETMKKRISRSKAIIKENKIPFEIPSQSELDKRLDAVLHVIYLIYNEGYSASTGEDHIRKELTGEAIFLGRKLVELGSWTESMGLLALLLLQESRRDARVTGNGEIIPLENQDRSRWNQELIREGLLLYQKVVMSGRLGVYSLQAAIASVHAVADTVQNTQWDLIISYYDMLLSIHLSPVVELNRAIAVGMHEGPEAGLALIEQLHKTEKLKLYPGIYSAQAEFLKKAGHKEEAIGAYRRAFELVEQGPEKRYLERKLSEV